MNFLSASFIGLIPLCAILLLFPSDSMSGDKTDAKDNGSTITNRGKDMNNAPTTTQTSDSKVNGSTITNRGKDMNDAPTTEISDTNVNGSTITNRGKETEMEDAKPASVDAGEKKFTPRRDENQDDELSEITNPGERDTQSADKKKDNVVVAPTKSM